MLTKVVHVMAMTWTGPLLCALATVLIAVPPLRPVRLLYPLWGLCGLMALPFPDFFLHFNPFGYTFRPFTAAAGLALSMTYLVMVVRLKLPRLSAVPAVVLLMASLAESWFTWSIASGEFWHLIKDGL